MPIRMKVGLGPDHIVLDGDQAHPMIDKHIILIQKHKRQCTILKACSG